MDAKLQYAPIGDLHLGYRTLDGGSGPPIVLVTAGIAHSVLYDDPVASIVLDGLREIGPVTVFDQLGFGTSDPIGDRVGWSDHSYRALARDLTGLIQAAELSDPVVISGGMAAHGAALAAQSVNVGKLVLLEPFNPWLWDELGLDVLSDAMLTRNRERAALDQFFYPERMEDPTFRTWIGSARSHAAPPGVARQVLVNREVAPVQDAQSIYAAMTVPALLIRRRDIDRSPFLADTAAGDISHFDRHIPATARVQLPGREAGLFGAHPGPLVAAIREFVTESAPTPPVSRVVRAVLYTDLGGSTEQATELGDYRWKGVLDEHDDICRRAVEVAGGDVIKTTGDGVLAILPSSAAAIGAAVRIRSDLTDLGLHVRAGIHVGDIELRDGDVSGLTVNIAARIMDKGEAGEVLLSDAATDAAIGIRHEITPAGTHLLKGLPGEWGTHRL